MRKKNHTIEAFAVVMNNGSNWSIPNPHSMGRPKMIYPTKELAEEALTVVHESHTPMVVPCTIRFKLP